MVGGSGDEHNLLSCVVLKTIETIETILKNNIFLFQHCLLALSYHNSLNRGVKQLQLFKAALAFQNNVVFYKISVCFTTARACARWA